MSPVDCWEQIRNCHLQYLAEETGVSNGWEYFKEYGPSNPKTPKIRSELKSVTNLAAFERVYPAISQDLALVMMNPKLTESAGVDRQLADLDAHDYSGRTSQSAEGLRSWFGSDGSVPSRNPQKAIVTEIIPEIIYRTSLLQSKATHPAKGNFFENIYYTNWYKLATVNGGSIPGGFRSSVTPSIPSVTLRMELAEVNPELVVTFGGYSWRAFREFSSPAQDSDGIPHTHRVSDVEGYLYDYEHKGTSFKVLPFKFRPIQTSKGNFPKNLDTL